MRRLVVCLCLVACGGSKDPAVTLRVWHTFGPDETAALNEALPKDVAVEGTVLPFGLARNRLAWALDGHGDCPDLARIDASWLFGLAPKLTPIEEARLAGFTPEAADLARWDGKAWGLPQAVDGLALITAEPIAPPETLDDLERLARTLTTPTRKGISARADGYWFVAWLRANGGDFDRIDSAAAVHALARYAAVVEDGYAFVPAPAGDEAALEARRFADGELAIVVGGPWTVPALRAAAERRGRTLELHVTPFPHAPDGTPAAPGGGQLWVVPACAAHPAEAWALAETLTAPALQADWSRRLGVVPTRRAALADASPLAREFAAALAATRPLRREPITPLLFDDLTPAVQAVLAGDATAVEALAGVARAWARLRSRP